MVVFERIMRVFHHIHIQTKTMNEIPINVATAIATAATALFTGFSAYIMHKERTHRRTPEVKVRIDPPESNRNYFRVSLFFTPGESDYPISSIRVKGCQVSQRFTFATFGMPPRDLESPMWQSEIRILVN